MEGESILLGCACLFFYKCKKNSFMDWMKWSQVHDKDSNCIAVMCSNLPTKRGCFVFCCCIILKLNNVFTLFLLSPFPVNEGDTAPAAPHIKLLKCLSSKGKRIIRVSWHLSLSRDGDFWSYREPYFPSLEHLCHNTDFFCWLWEFWTVKKNPDKISINLPSRRITRYFVRGKQKIISKSLRSENRGNV